MTSPRAVYVSNLFPSREEPHRGVFNLRQLEALRAAGLVFDVVSPRPWFPFAGGRPAARTGPGEQDVAGFRVTYPRVLYLPLSRGRVNGRLFALSLERRLRPLHETARPAFLWSSFAFPDGVGVGRIAHRLGTPHVVSVLGSDLNSNVGRPGRLDAIVRTLGEARLVFAKSRALRDGLLANGVAPEKVFVDYNGVDSTVFFPRPRLESCARLGLSPGPRRVLFVGNLVPVKNVPTLIAAFLRLRSRSDDVELAVVGEGFLGRSLRRQVERSGLGGAVRMPGRCAADEVPLWLGASDLLCLPSLSEGVPNVVLEAMACGRPVVASAVGGISEIHPGAPAGALVPPRDDEALAQALDATLARAWDPEKLRALVRELTWPANAQKALTRFAERGLLDGRGPERAAGSAKPGSKR